MIGISHHPIAVTAGARGGISPSRTVLANHRTDFHVSPYIGYHVSDVKVNASWQLMPSLM